ncbi:MAG: trigger factor [Chitinophagaceae bacterium]
MAVVTQENIGLYHEKISISLSKEDYMPSVDKAIKQYSKNASIPGFRKGMVPQGLIRKMYGQSVFADEVMRVAGTKLEEHLIENKAEIFARPLPVASQDKLEFDINTPKDFVFEFEIGTKPVFNIPIIEQKQTVDLYKVIVTHEMLDQEVDNMLYKAGEMTDPEEVTEEDNVLNVTFTNASQEGESTEEPKDNSLLVKYFTPEMQAKLMGAKSGDQFEIILKSAFNDKVLLAIMKDLGLNPQDENQQAQPYQMNITKVGLVKKAPLTQETFDKIFPGRGLEDEQSFRDAVTAEIQKYWDDQAKIRLHNELFERLVHETPIELPVPFLKRWLSVGGETYKSPEQVEKEFGGFEHSLRWQLITDRIIEENQIQVEEEDLEMAARMQIMSYFGQYGNMPSMDADWMEPFVKKQLADQKFRDELYGKIMTDKVFYTLENSLTIAEHDLSLDEFINKPMPHHHH